MRLGRLPHDPMRLALAPLHFFAAAQPAPVLDRAGVNFVPKLYANDVLPDCTAVGLANAARAAGALADFEPAIDDVKVPAFYAVCIGKPGATDAELEATDGAMLLDVLERQASAGFDVGEQAPLVGSFGTVSTSSRIALALGMAHGAGYWGVDLYERDMELPPVWDDDGSSPGALVGGHCIIAWDYAGLGDGQTVRVGTWGAWQPATWRWVHARLREAHSVSWRQLEAAA